MRKLGKAFLIYALVVQFAGAAFGAFIAVYYGPEAENIAKEIVRYVAS